MRFTLPEYWRGKVDVVAEESGVRITAKDSPGLPVLTASLKDSCPLGTWEELADESAIRYGLPDGSEALDYRDTRIGRAVGGVRAHCSYKVSDDSYIYFACGAGDGTGDASAVDDLRSLGTGSEFSDDNRFKPFEELWASAMRT